MGQHPEGLMIGALAKRAQSSVQTIRFYEKIRLMPAPPRTRAGRRIYDETHVLRLRIIRRYRSFGFSIPRVRQLLDLLDHEDENCSQARKIAEMQCAELRRRIVEALALERQLSGYIACCNSACADEVAAGISLQAVLANANSTCGE
jgi:MerR family mercuric resistance operon transcriptional regulator